MQLDTVHLFNAERWFTAWDAVGGACYLGQPIPGISDHAGYSLLVLGPTHLRCGSAEHRAMRALRAQSDADDRRRLIVEHLARRRATMGE